MSMFLVDLLFIRLHTKRQQSETLVVENRLSFRRKRLINVTTVALLFQWIKLMKTNTQWTKHREFGLRKRKMQRLTSTQVHAIQIKKKFYAENVEKKIMIEVENENNHTKHLNNLYQWQQKEERIGFVLRVVRFSVVVVVGDVCVRWCEWLTAPSNRNLLILIDLALIFYITTKWNEFIDCVLLRELWIGFGNSQHKCL